VNTDDCFELKDLFDNLLKHKNINKFDECIEKIEKMLIKLKISKIHFELKNSLDCENYDKFYEYIEKMRKIIIE
jgi:hypothetical protein